MLSAELDGVGATFTAAGLDPAAVVMLGVFRDPSASTAALRWIPKRRHFSVSG